MVIINEMRLIMTLVNVQRFVMYNYTTGKTATYNPEKSDVKDLIIEYLFGNRPTVITLDNLYCISKIGDELLCIEVLEELPPHHELESCNWFYQERKVDLQPNYSHMESYFHDLKISPNAFQQGYLSTR